MTNLASSLRDDDLMISSSQVDPLEQRNLAATNNANRPTSLLGATDKSKMKAIAEETEHQLAIQEESSSLKSVSPLTEHSQSKKSNLIQGSPAKFSGDGQAVDQPFQVQRVPQQTMTQA